MAENSKIGWTDHTHNFWWGCHKVSEECRHCYIAGIMRRGGKEPFNGPMRTKNWSNPQKWNRQAEAAGRRQRIFTCSMSDFFHPEADEWRAEAWQLIKECNWLDWLVLTKRPELVSNRLPADWGTGYSNVWLGTTAGCESSLERVQQLTKIPAALRFVSAEPLLEPIDLTPHLESLDWVITGCERAKKGVRRLMELDWIRNVDEQCRLAGVPHFFKQYYHENQGLPREDGMLDGVPTQAWPESHTPVAA